MAFFCRRLVCSLATAGLAQFRSPGPADINAAAARCLCTSRPGRMSSSNPNDTQDVVSPPPLSTLGASTHFVKSPGFDVIGNIILLGKPNLDHSSTGLDVAEVLTGCQQAVEVASGELADGHLEALQDLMTESCLNRLSPLLAEIPDQQRKRLALQTEDIFLSWLTQIMSKDGLHTVTFVTMSVPDYGMMRHLASESRRKRKEFLEHLRQNPPKDVEERQKRMSEHQDEVRQAVEGSGVRSHMADLVLANWVFQQVGENQQWKIADVAIKGGKATFSPFYNFRWRSRVMLSLNGFKLINILRYDYATDFLALAVLLFILLPKA